MQNKLINVFYHGRKVGRLAETPDKLLAFEYDAEWLGSGFPISPFKLPLEKRVFIAQRDPFDGNFGVFNDSLPDSWGRLLIDRMLIKKHIDPASISILDRLAIVGKSGMGALEYEPEEQLVDDVKIDDLNILARETEALLNEKYNGQKLEELVKLGGSSGGARPKVFLNIDGKDWLIKFRTGSDPKNIGKQEFAYMTAAKTAALIVPETRLFEGKYFGVTRFDRKANGKVFMISASGLLNTSHRFPTLDYTSLMTLTLELTHDFREAAKMFRLMCFNVFAHNRDDHSKNFSFLYDDERWKLSPAYDLVYADGMGGEHATSIDGEGRNPGEKHIMAVAKKSGLDLRKAKKIMEEVRTAVKVAGIL
ncbi:MAG: type II toxin-antitoxin system HipA family toxin [Treponema sp.]|jgi:serine/threonine-protein kinase HipA|nr:type II toxin-antitoxin system HipA family toxin [Treponema sp.]